MMEAQGCVTFGRARFSFYSDRLVRLEWSENARFEDRPTLRAKRPEKPTTPVTVERTDSSIRIHTAHLRLDYRESADGFTRKTLQVAFRHRGRNRIWRFGQSSRNRFKGLARSLDNCDGEDLARVRTNEAGQNEVIPRGRRVPVDEGVVSTEGWAVVDDSGGLPLDNAGKADQWYGEPIPGARVDQYLFVHGDDFKAAVSDATRVFGTQPLPPRFVFGYWYSRFRTYTEPELLELVDRFDALSLPIDVLVIDMDWHRPGWTGFSWDTDLFPDPPKLLRGLHSRNLRVTLNLHPADGVAPHEDGYPGMKKSMALDSEFSGTIPFAPTDPKFMRAYFDCLLHPLEDEGVDFWWMDWQQGSESDRPGLDPLDWLAHAHWIDQIRRRPRERPLNFTRYSGIGSGSMPLSFLGDTFTTWKSLAAQPGYIARGAHVLHGYLSPDIGGHLTADTSPELYLRWLQSGVYSPVMRTHASKDPRSERRVWQFPEPYRELLSDALRQRYRMVPYLYSEGRETERTGLSLQRPLFYEFPDYRQARTEKTAYFLGSRLLVAPVTTPSDSSTGLARVRFWLPPGEWIDTARGLRITGGDRFSARYLRSEIPVFVRPGSVIPGQRGVLRCGEGSAPNLEITCWPGGDGAYTIHEDDGHSIAYREGRRVRLPIRYREKTGRSTISIGEAEGRFRGFQTKRPLHCLLPMRLPPREVRLNGEFLPFDRAASPGTWSYQGDTATIRIQAGRIDLRGISTLEVIHDGAGSPPNGVAGLLSRAVAIGAEARALSLWTKTHDGERLPSKAELTGHRIDLDPSTARREWEMLRNRLAEGLDAMRTTRRNYRARARRKKSVYFGEMADAMDRPIALCRATLKDFPEA